jgi:uncharacterized protein (DUF488 family)
MYYRRKIILALLESCGGTLPAISFQKLLFLFTRKQEVKAFDFIPYFYGCFSFQANQDISTLKTYGYINLLEDGKHIQLAKQENYSLLLNLFDKQYIEEIKEEFSNLSQDDLIKYTYLHYPYYAIKSTIANKILTTDGMQKVRQQVKTYNEPMLFTIGYEGISLETYINKLIISDVKVLCDVRKNAFSQKYGFSKSQLEKACQGVGIKYVHIPALGIESELRKNLISQKDYDILFDNYEQTTLNTNDAYIEVIFNFLNNDKRVALTCFEKSPMQCHRSRITKRLMSIKNKDYTLNNL